MKTTSMLAAACLMTLALACGGGGGGGGDGGTRIGASTGGTVTLPGGPSLQIPADALAADTTFTIRRSDASGPDGAVTALYTFGPGGTRFLKPVTVSFPLPSGTTTGLVRWTVEGGSNGYQTLPTTIGGGAASAQVMHLSSGYVGPATYGLPDVQGSWQGYAIASEPWWERAAATVAADGTLTGTTTDNDGTKHTVSDESFSVAGDGTVTIGGGKDAPIQAYLDAGATVMSWVDSWVRGVPGTPEQFVLIKMAGAYDSSDLVGDWGFAVLASSPGAPWWYRAHGAIADDLSLTGTWEDSGGDSGAAGGDWAISSKGEVTMSGPGASGTFALNASKTVMAGNKTQSDTSAELDLGVKLAAAYDPSDVAGTWAITALATGAAPRWWRALATVAADGSLSGARTYGNQPSDTLSGVVAVSAQGVVTVNGSDYFGGFMDADKSVIVATDTEGDESVLLVFTKQR